MGNQLRSPALERLRQRSRFDNAPISANSGLLSGPSQGGARPEPSWSHLARQLTKDAVAHREERPSTGRFRSQRHAGDVLWFDAVRRQETPDEIRLQRLQRRRLAVAVEPLGNGISE